MLQIESLVVTPVKIDQVLLQWRFKPTLESLLDYTCRIERSESPDGDWERLHLFVDETQYLDKLYYRRLWRNLHYRIVITRNSDGAIWSTVPVQFGYEPNLEALEIIRRNDILLKNRRHGIGIPVLYFIRKHDGIRCLCWDADKKRVRKADCDDCYQTGFMGGFYPPQVVWINTSPDIKQNPISQWGEAEANDAKVFMSNYPIANPKDLIIDPVRLRLWIVDKVEPSARRACLLHQTLVLSYVDRSSALYKLIEVHPAAIQRASEEGRRIKLS